MCLSCSVPIALCPSLITTTVYLLFYLLLLLMWPPVLWVSRGSQRSYWWSMYEWVSNEWVYFWGHFQGSKSSKISQIRFLPNRFFRKAGLGWARLQVSCFHNVDDALLIFASLIFVNNWLKLWILSILLYSFSLYS